MKALILAAGLGTRLQPYTDHTPKPLFPVLGTPLLDKMITKLIDAGCQAIIINTHHLHEQIETFIAQQSYSIPVQTRYEPTILGTGGAIRNVKDFWSDDPFMVINSDIVTTINLKSVYDSHCRHSHPATLVLADDADFNSVVCDSEGFVAEFQNPSNIKNRPSMTALTFTGIQVLDPEIIKYIPAGVPSSSIDAYTRMIGEGKKIKVYFSSSDYWKDIGTVERYKAAVFEVTAPEVFKRIFPDLQIGPIAREPLKGDGSDRQWSRLKMGTASMIVVDHGIRERVRPDEADAFVNIGRHLFDRGIPVPQIYAGDTFSGYVFLEDLGNLDLQTMVRHTDNPEKIIPHYQSVIDLLSVFSASGAQQFETSWTCQTPRYSRTLILENECRYFVEAFLNTYLGLETAYNDFKTEFEYLADNALQYAMDGLMHRDFQSRNIMVKNDDFYFIDFQGSRLGPIQYDLASLLIDPYVQLPSDIQGQLLQYAVERLKTSLKLNARNFRRCYRYCRLTRNLQILGAFGYLSRVKAKSYFEQYIPPAVQTLRRNLKKHEQKTLPMLIDLMNTVIKHPQIQNSA